MLQGTPGGPWVGEGNSYTFTPDVGGTYTVQLSINDGVNAQANAVVSSSGSGGDDQQESTGRVFYLKSFTGRSLGAKSLTGGDEDE
jgi:hypothetical protein